MAVSQTFVFHTLDALKDGYPGVLGNVHLSEPFDVFFFFLMIRMGLWVWEEKEGGNTNVR